MAATARMGGGGARDGSGKRVDKRVVRTKKAIRDAFFRLLGSCEYEKISIAALAREAGVDRKTFYLHYSSIDALADEIMRERVQCIVASLNAAERDERQGAEADRGERLFMPELFSALWSEMAPDLTHLRSQMRHIPVAMILDRMPDLLTEALIEDGRLGRGMAGRYEGLGAAFVSAGLIAMFRRWLFSDDRLPIDDVSVFAETLVMKGVEGASAFACRA